MQKVMSFNVNTKIPNDNSFNLIDSTELNKVLEEGWKVVSVHQIAPTPSIYAFTITFVLEK